MADTAVNLQTPIMVSVRTQLKDLQEEKGHVNPGETIGWLIDEVEDCHTLCAELRVEAEQAMQKVD